MKIQVPEKVTFICRVLYSEGFSSWIVGGCVRDSLLGRKAHDWDIATTATPNEIINIFEKTIPTGIKFGTVTVMVNGEGFEVTTLRQDGNYGDGRRPDNVTFSSDIIEDLSRRDFTINAMAYDVVREELIDPFGGATDLENQILRAVGNPVDRFNEDGLRLMRAARFCATHNLIVAWETSRAMDTCCKNILRVSKERVRDEILKSLSADRPSTAFSLLEQTGILKRILPELSQQVGCRQNSYHDYDVWGHTMTAVDLCESKDVILKLAVLLHDIGKTKTQQPKKGCAGEYTFYEHEDIGAEIADNWMKEYKFSNEERQRVTHLVRYHLILWTKQWTKRTVRRFINRVGAENIDDLFTVRIADLRGKSQDIEQYLLETIDLALQVDEILTAQEPVQKSQLAINGHDVQEALGIKPGPVVGKALNFLFEAVLDNPEINTREKLLDLIKEYEK